MILTVRNCLSSRIANKAGAIFLFALLMVISGWVRIPLPGSPVPVTLQTMVVLLSGALLGGMSGAGVQGAYILSGMLGLPVFSTLGSGYLYMAGPTGGYMAGFVVASFIVGKGIVYCRKNVFLVFTLMSLASFVILFCGMLWLKILLGLPFSKLLTIGVMPFIPGDLFKSALAAMIFMRISNKAK